MTLLKRVLQDAGIYGVGAVVAGALGVLLLPVYARLLSKAEFGVLELLVVVGALVKLAVALQITQGVARLYGDAEGEPERGRLISTAWWFSALAYSLFAAAAVAGAAWIAPRLLGASGSQGIWVVGALGMSAGGVFYFWTHMLRWQLLPGKYARALIAQVVASHGIGLYLLVVHGWGVLGVLAGQLTGNLIGAGMGWWWSRARCRLAFSRQKLREMLAYSTPLVPSSLAVFVALYIDRIAISRFMTMEDLGLYSVGFRLASASGLILVGFRSAWMPQVLASYKEKDAPAQMAKVFRYFMFLVLGVVMGLGLFAPELLRLLTTAEFLPVAKVVPLLAAATVLSSMYLFAPGLELAKRTRVIAVINVVAAAVNTGLNVLLIPLWGLYGAAVATLTSAALSFALYMRKSQKLYPVPHEWRRHLASVVIVAIAVAAGMLLIEASMPWGLSLLARVIVAGIAALLLLQWLIGWAELAPLWRRALAAVRH